MNVTTKQPRDGQMPRELTPRQKQILQMLVDGLTPKEIGSELLISYQTVKKHLRMARRQFGVSTRDELVARAVAHGDIHVFMGEVQIEMLNIDSKLML